MWTSHFFRITFRIHSRWKSCFFEISSEEVTLLWQGYSHMTSCCQRVFVPSSFHLKSLGTSWSNVSQPAVKCQSALRDKSSSHDSASLWFNWRPQTGVDNGLLTTVLICSLFEWLVEYWNWGCVHWWYSEIKCLLCPDWNTTHGIEAKGFRF